MDGRRQMAWRRHTFGWRETTAGHGSTSLHGSRCRRLLNAHEIHPCDNAMPYSNGKGGHISSTQKVWPNTSNCQMQVMLLVLVVNMGHVFYKSSHQWNPQYINCFLGLFIKDFSTRICKQVARYAGLKTILSYIVDSTSSLQQRSRPRRGIAFSPITRNIYT